MVAWVSRQTVFQVSGPKMKVTSPDYSINISKEQIPIIYKCIVYGLKRVDKYLYIGRSHVGTKRISYGLLISRSFLVKDNDIIDIWLTNEDEINEMEIFYIKHFQPEFNIDGTSHPKKLPRFNSEGKQICYDCNKKIERPRPNKLFCNHKCKGHYWRNRSELQRFLENLEDRVVKVNETLRVTNEYVRKILGH